MKGVKTKVSIDHVDRGVHIVRVAGDTLMEVYRSDFTIRIRVEADKTLIDHEDTPAHKGFNPDAAMVRHKRDTNAVVVSLLKLAAAITDGTVEV